MADPLYQQDTDIAVVLALAAHCGRRTFMDVGAEKGEFARSLMGLGWTGDLFEPFPRHLAELRALVAGSGSRVFEMAIDETDHPGLLHIAVNADGTTMDYFHSLHRDDANPFARHTEPITVPCRSLGSLAEEGSVDSGVGILKIDTEGNDLKVIRGLGKVKAEVLICEFVTPKLYKTWENSFPEALVEAARQRGYEKCIAVKRFGAFELVDFDPAGFAGGQWGNLVFTSEALFALTRKELNQIANDCENRLLTLLQEKEKLIVDVGARLEYLTARMQNLELKVEKQSAKELELRDKIARLKEKAS